MTVHKDSVDLVNVMTTEISKSHMLTRKTAEAWEKMQSAASLDNINLYIVSSFRNFNSQKKIIMEKIKIGQNLEEIFSVSAPPGFSEHHTGRAIDIGTISYNPLTLSFESTEAFDWLMHNANKFGYYLSYPRGNTAGFEYEPWHWFYRDV